MKSTLDEFLGKRGLSFPVSDFMLDKVRFPHGLTQRQEDKLEKDYLKDIECYSKKRNKAITEYKVLVAKGEIVEKTRNEQTLERAKYGHPDNESTQAARRICAKKGLDYENYQPSEEII